MQIIQCFKIIIVKIIILFLFNFILFQNKNEPVEFKKDGKLLLFFIFYDFVFLNVNIFIQSIFLFLHLSIYICQ